MPDILTRSGVPPPAVAPPQKFPDIGKYLTYQEAIFSNTAKLYNLKNEPNKTQYDRIVYHYHTMYEPLCDWAGEKIPVNSWFRGEALNNLVPGASATSAHMSGSASDLDCQRFDNPITNNQLFERIRTGKIKFDALIAEAPDKHGVPSWIHIATEPGRARGLVLKMVRTKAGIVYTHWPFRL